jgi:hypothetical protein
MDADEYKKAWAGWRREHQDFIAARADRSMRGHRYTDSLARELDYERESGSTVSARDIATLLVAFRGRCVVNRV